MKMLACFKAHSLELVEDRETLFNNSIGDRHSNLLKVKGSLYIKMCHSCSGSKFQQGFFTTKNTSFSSGVTVSE